MGLFGKKNKKVEEVAETKVAPSKRSKRSRRIIAPKNKEARVEEQSNTFVKERKKSKPKAIEPKIETIQENDVLDLDLVEEAPAAEQSDNLFGYSSTGDNALIQFLIEQEMITETQADDIRLKAKEMGRPIDAAAVEMNFFTESTLVDKLAKGCWVPNLKVDKYNVRKKALDVISYEEAKYYSLLPLDKLGKILSVAMVNPFDEVTINKIVEKSSLDIKKVLATRTEIEEAIEKYYVGSEGLEVTNDSLKISQDVKPERVTQMMSKAELALDTEGLSKETTSITSEPVIKEDSDIFDDDIMDIDDLLDGDDIIEPTAISPISITADDMIEDEAFEEPVLTSNFERKQDSEELLEEVGGSALESPESSVLNLESDDDDMIEEEVLEEVSELEDDVIEEVSELEDDVIEEVSELEDDVIEEVAEQPSEKLEEKESASAFSVSPNAAKLASVAPKIKTVPKKVITDLQKINEKEFQHAITHSKARIFEKWVAIQTRGRILNAAKVDDSVVDILEPLFEENKIQVDVG